MPKYNSVEEIVTFNEDNSVSLTQTKDEILNLVIDNLNFFSAKWHPLGFLHLPLIKNERTTIRLHVWPTGNRNTQEPNYPIHNHLFDIESNIFCGVIENTEYDINWNPSEPSHYLYDVAYEGQLSRINKTDDCVLCAPKSSQCYFAGQSYRIKQGSFHASRVDEGCLTATLVTTSHHVDVAPKVLVGLNAEPTFIYDRVECDKDQLRNVLSSVLAECRNMPNI